VTFLWLLSLKTGGYVPTDSNKQQNKYKKTYFLLASWKLLMKKAGPGSVNQVYESNNLDSNSWYQNVMDPEHSIPCLEEMNIPTGGLEALMLELMRFKQKNSRILLTFF
jgi:hypothetical protein